MSINEDLRVLSMICCMKPATFRTKSSGSISHSSKRTYRNVLLPKDIVSFHPVSTNIEHDTGIVP